MTEVQKKVLLAVLGIGSVLCASSAVGFAVHKFDMYRLSHAELQVEETGAKLVNKKGKTLLNIPVLASEKSEEVKSEEVKSEEVKSEEAKTEEAKTEEAK